MIDQQAAPKAEAERFSLRVTHAIMRANLSVTLKHLLNLICYHHNDERGYAWPSIERLALMSGNVNTRTIQRQLRTLQESGLIDIQPMPGLRTNAYQLQEHAIAAIAISGITWPKNVLGHPDFACATPDTRVALPRHQSASTLTLDATYPDTGATLTEDRNGKEELKKNGGGTDVNACAPQVPAPAPATPAAPALTSSPALFASQPQKPEQPRAATTDASVFAHLVDRINAQRASNGKTAFTLADHRQLAAEAAKAGITTVQAAEWILERSGRNFFKADYFAPPAPAPVAPTAPAQPAPQPAPAPALTAEQCAEQEAAVASERAKLKAMFAQLSSAPAAATADTPLATTTADTLVVRKTGHAWADNIIADAIAGQPVNTRPLEMACQLAKVAYSDVRAAQKRAAAALTAIAA